MVPEEPGARVPRLRHPPEVEAALGLGLTTVKLFPAEVVGA